MIRIFIQKLKKINDFVDNMGCLVTILCASFIMMTVFLIVAFWPGMVSTFIEELLGGDLRFTDIIEIAALFGSQIVPNVYFEKENRLGGVGALWDNNSSNDLFDDNHTRALR